jgi:hypothetical protein
MRWKCVEKCFFGGQMFSPNQSEGKLWYEGSQKPPQGKDGRPFFEADDPTGVVPSMKAVDIMSRAATNGQLTKYEYRKLSKIELQQLIKAQYHIQVAESKSKFDLVEMVLELQAKNPPNNAEIAKAEGV